MTSSLPLPCVGVAAALAPRSSTPTRTVFSQFTLLNRVALITGGHRGLGLEMALVLAEAGAIAYCLDLPLHPDSDWLAVQTHISRLPDLTDPATGEGNEGARKGRLEYVSGNVTDQKGMWTAVEEIVRKEQRIDICVANAGIAASFDCLESSADEFKKIVDVNVNGVFFAAQAAGRQMERLRIPGSIVLIASMAGRVALQGLKTVAYDSSKSAVIQMARSLACELGPKGIRVNSISPGYIYTDMSRASLIAQPGLLARWCSQNPLGRLGKPGELRGVVLWLAGEASTFCTGSNITVDGGHTAW